MKRTPTTPEARERSDRAFQTYAKGSQARLIGWPLNVNPYPQQQPAARLWEKGWRDANRDSRRSSAPTFQIVRIGR